MADFLAAQAIAFLAGAGLVLALGGARLPAGLFVPAAWLGGTGALAVERLLLAQAGWTWTPEHLAAPWIGVAALAGLRGLAARRRTWRAWLRRARMVLRGPIPFGFVVDVAVAAGIVGWTAALLWQATNTPLEGWDAWAMWFLKGRALYQAGGVPAAFFTDPVLLPYAHMDYPPLVPLTIAGTYAWTGDLDPLMKGWWALLAGAAAAGLYGGLAGLVGRAARLGGVVLAWGVPEFLAHTTGYYTGYADLPLAVLALYGAIFLYRWLRRPTAGHFTLAALFFSLAGFTKSEGIVVAGAGLGLLVLLGPALVWWDRRRWTWTGLAGAAVVVGLALLPWAWQRQAWSLTGDYAPTWAGVEANWAARSGPIWDSLHALVTDPARFNQAWPLLPLLGVGALLFAPRRWLTTLPVLALVAAQVGVAVVAYLVTPFDLAWQLSNSADRVIFQAVPPALLLGTLYLGLLLDRAPRRDDGRQTTDDRRQTTDEE
jgi:hypothetical protein